MLENTDLLLNPKKYLETFTKIRTKEKKIIPWKVNKVQEDLFCQLQKERRVAILKARQIGVSTGTIGFLYHDTIIHSGVNSVIVGYSREAASTLFEIVKLLWASTPKGCKPDLKYDTKYEMSFPKLNSKISVLPASRAAGRGLTIHNLLATELAYWQHEDTFYGLLEAVPVEGRILVESTPNGHDKLFWPLWANEKSGFKRLGYGWDWVYSKEWAEKKRKEIGTHRFNQEYGLTFLHPEGSVFDPNWNKYYQRCSLAFKLPIYIGVDPAASQKEKSDYSAVIAIVYNPITQRIWVLEASQGRMTNHQLANKILNWNKKYKPTLIGIETSAYQVALKQELDRIAGEEGYSLPIREIKPFINKLQRFRALSTYFENGFVYLKRDQEELIEQLGTYPKCPHEDLIDALEIAVSLTKEKERRPIISLVG